MSDKKKVELCATLKELRLQNGLSQADVADKIGVSQGTYFRMENGSTKIDDATIDKLARLFKMTTRNLMAYGDYKKSLSLGHLAHGAMEFVLDPKNAVFIQTAIIDRQISDLMKAKEELLKNMNEQMTEKADYGTLVRPITKLFENENEKTDFETIQTAIEWLKELHDGNGDFNQVVGDAISDLEALLESKTKSDEEIDAGDLFYDANACIDSLRLY